MPVKRLQRAAIGWIPRGLETRYACYIMRSALTGARIGRRFVPAQRVVRTRRILPVASYHTYIASEVRELLEAIGRQGMSPIGAPLAIIHSDLSAGDTVDAEVCVPVGPTLFGRGIRTEIIEAVTVAFIPVAAGASFEVILRAYDHLRNDVFHNDGILVDDPREVYGAGTNGAFEIQYPVVYDADL